MVEDNAATKRLEAHGHGAESRQRMLDGFMPFHRGIEHQEATPASPEYFAAPRTGDPCGVIPRIYFIIADANGDTPFEQPILVEYLSHRQRIVTLQLVSKLIGKPDHGPKRFLHQC